MTRLTNTIRAKMVNKAIETAGITEAFAALRTRRAKLAEDVRIFALGGVESVAKIEKAVAKIKKLQTNDDIKKVSRSGFCCASGNAMTYCNLAGAQVHLFFNGKFSKDESGDPVYKSIIPQDVTLTADNPLVDDFHFIAKDRDALISRRDGLRAQVAATLGQFTTIKKLLEQWPEAKDLLPSDLNESKPQLPVVQVKDLNCLIGLPTGDADA